MDEFPITLVEFSFCAFYFSISTIYGDFRSPILLVFISAIQNLFNTNYTFCFSTKLKPRSINSHVKKMIASTILTTLFISPSVVSAVTSASVITHFENDSSIYYENTGNIDSNSPYDISSKPAIPESDPWIIRTHKQEITFVALDEILTPIETSRAAVTFENKSGTYIIENGEMTAATQIPAIETQHSSDHIYSRRPVLFVSIPGFQLQSKSLEFNPSDGGFHIQGSKWADWQNKLDFKLHPQLEHYQYKHFIVAWDNQKSMRLQVESTANQIKRFLAGRKYSWDVVLIGHSRGGIFAHQLSRHLVGHAKIRNLHSYLLDPTASPTNGDQYPTYLPSNSATPHIGIVICDEKLEFSVNTGINDSLTFGTWSDAEIKDYRYVVYPGSSHESIHEDWMDSDNYGLPNLLSELIERPDGYFEVDGTSGLDVIVVSAHRGVHLDGELYRENGTYYVWGELTVDGFSVAHVDGSIGTDGFSAAIGITFVGSAQIAIQNDQLAVAASFNGVSGYYTASLQDGVQSNINVGVIRAGYDIGGSGGTAAYIDFGKIELEASLVDGVCINDRCVKNAVGASALLTSDVIKLVTVIGKKWF